MAWRDAALRLQTTNPRLAVGLSALLLALGVASSPGKAQPPADGLPKGKDVSGKRAAPPAHADGPAKAKAAVPSKAAAPPAAAVKPGLAVNDPRAFQGYTLFGPFDSTTTYLIDMQGRVVHTWESDCA